MSGVTMKTVAKAAGVTTATVSMALRNHPRISAATRERIAAIVNELGYVPDPYVARLMRLRKAAKPTRDRPILGLICAQETEDGWRRHPAPTIRAMLDGASRRGVERGYRPQEFWLHRDGMSNERFSGTLYARGIEGLIVSPLSEGAPPIELHWQNFSVVSLSVPLPNVSLTTVSNDHYNSSLRVARECLDRGYRRLGLILKAEHTKRFEGRWEAGLLAAVTAFSQAPLLPVFYLSGQRDASRLLEWARNCRPDAIITSSAQLMPGMLQVLERGGFSVPKDIGLAVLACPELGSEQSGIFQNGALIGAKAVDVVLGMLERHERGLISQAQSFMIQGVWNEGTTLPRKQRFPDAGTRAQSSRKLVRATQSGARDDVLSMDIPIRPRRKTPKK
ncbi:MAG: LacI family DNA-binding transcriptional regulator [Opitutaceae bacterium]|nr:LacI family DNA-binding transcriptional regulator [Opitutaceae bacterium]